MDAEIDDDVLFVSHGIPTLQSQHLSTTTKWKCWGNFHTWFMDVITGPRFGILAAILVIVVFQSKSRIESLVRKSAEDGWQHTWLGYVVGVKETIRAYYQMACEFFRRLKPVGTQPVQLASKSRSPRGGSPPPLVHVNPDLDAESAPLTSISNVSDVATNLVGVQGLSSHPGELEPAFLDEHDYPPGWLVYHSRLGVVSKEEADGYDSDHRRSKLHQPVLGA
eukprot:scaffold2526_cov131-Cylindrotheca_fusiformis.AAC.15